MARRVKKEVSCEITVPALREEVFDAWLNPANSPFHEHEKLIVNRTVDGLWYWLVHGVPHYGRFMEFRRPLRVRHTWMSPNTAAVETMVSVTFRKRGDETLMTLVHSGFPSLSSTRAHRAAWNRVLADLGESLTRRADKRRSQAK